MKITLLFIAWLLASQALAQSAAVDTANRYRTYLDQVALMMRGRRAVPSEEVFQRLRIVRNMSITSDSSLGRAISLLYPAHNPDSIAIIFYTYQRGVLTSTLFAPGARFEQIARPISRANLQQLAEAVSQALRINGLLASRAPRLRGARPVAEPAQPQQSLDVALREATRVLLPFKTPLRQFRHVVFIPAYNIGTFPLALLRPFGTNEYLVDHCSYSIAPGLADFLTSRQLFLVKYRQRELQELIEPGQQGAVWRRFQGNFTLEHPLFVANPQYPAGGRYYFPNLPGADKEVQAVLPYAHKGSTTLRGPQARKDSLLHYLGRADVLYIATHGIASATNPMDSSYLVLSGADPYLTAHQIQNLRLHTAMPELVVLSACQTGLGQADDAGVIGLARSFLIAGANDVVVSLWNVDDEATAYLMSRFMQHLVSEPYTYGPAEPLRKAMLDCRLKYPNPMHWASFMVAGMAY